MATVADELPGFPLEAMEEHVAAVLRQSSPAPRLDQRSADVLRVSLVVRRINATELRGFWLPFSGDYGIGPVRLFVERPVRLDDAAPPSPVSLPAIVWQTEQLAKGPWSASGAQVRRLLQTLLQELLADFRRAREP